MVDHEPCRSDLDLLPRSSSVPYDARPPPPAPAARAGGARHDRRGRRRAAVHAVRRLPAARGARARGRRAAARARRPRRPPDRSGARARPSRRGAARAGRPRGGRARGGRGPRGRPGPHRLVPVRRDAARHPGDAGARARGARPALRARRGRARAVAARARARATSTSCSPTSGSTSRARGRRASTATTCTATRSTWSCPPTTRPLAATATRCRWPSSPARPGPPATPGPAGRRSINRTCRELGGFDPDIRHRTNDSVICLALVAHGQAVDAAARARRAGEQPGRRGARDRRGLACTGPSSPPPAPRTPSGPPSRRCWRRCRQRQRTSAGPPERPTAHGSRALSGSGDQTAAMASAGASVHAATMRSGITVTGHFARCRTSWATLPSRARTRPTPRLPMTISSAR